MAVEKESQDTINRYKGNTSQYVGFEIGSKYLIDSRFIFYSLTDRDACATIVTGLTCYVAHTNPNQPDDRGAYYVCTNGSSNEWKEIKLGDGGIGATGPQGATGPSPVDVWKSQPGNSDKTNDDYYAYIKGATGPNAYEVWVSQGNTGKSYDDYFDYIKGATGPRGVQLYWTSSNTSYFKGREKDEVIHFDIVLSDITDVDSLVDGGYFNDPNAVELGSVFYVDCEDGYRYGIQITACSNVSGAPIDGTVISKHPIGLIISKTYRSLEELRNADATEVPEGFFVMISNDDTINSDTDNGRVYMRNSTAENTDVPGYIYITDLSGIQGIQGAPGIQGIRGTKWFTGGYIRREWNPDTESFTNVIETVPGATGPESPQNGDFYMNTTPSTEEQINHSEGDVFEYNGTTSTWEYKYTLAAGGATANLNWEVI